MNEKLTLVKVAFAGAFLMILWGSAEWFNPIAGNIYQDADKEKASTIRNHFDASGLYVWPSQKKTNQFSPDDDAVFFLIKQNGGFYKPGKFIGVQFFIWAVFWWILGALILRYKISSTREQLRFALTIVVLCQFIYHLPMWNWWGLSVSYVLYNFVNITLGITIALLVISTFFLKKQFNTLTHTSRKEIDNV